MYQESQDQNQSNQTNPGQPSSGSDSQQRQPNMQPSSPKSNAKIAVIVAVAILILSALVGFAVMNRSEDEGSSASEDMKIVTSPTKTNDENKGDESSTQTFTAAEVAQHSSEDDCWTIINESVYDITSYVPRHPGGDEILRACGTNGTSLFESRTTEDGEKVGSGSSHSSSAESQRDQMKIGELEQ